MRACVGIYVCPIRNTVAHLLTHFTYQRSFRSSRTRTLVVSSPALDGQRADDATKPGEWSLDYHDELDQLRTVGRTDGRETALRQV